MPGLGPGIHEFAYVRKKLVDPRTKCGDDDGEREREPMPTILDHIGNTRLLTLNHIGRDTGARISLKMEAENPTGSMKDRMALAMIEGAEKSGRLKPGGTVVEYTGGSTGVSLALICAVKRYTLKIV